MLVSTKGRYALRTMVDLAIHGDGEPVKIKDIASRQEISGKYLEQIISILSRAGYVRSIRGNQGGYYCPVRLLSIRWEIFCGLQRGAWLRWTV